MTHYLFIDTSVFVSQKLSLGSRTFRALKSMCQSKNITLLMCDITQREVFARIDSEAGEVVSLLRKASSKIPALRNLESYESLFEEDQRVVIEEALKNEFEGYLTECKPVNISATCISAKKVFDDYFQLKPPFGEGKKKWEFPDAFVITALSNWCEENNQCLTIVSGDNDFKKATELYDYFVYFDSLQKYINHILSGEFQIIGLLHDILESNKVELSGKIIEEIDGCDMILEDADPDGEAYIDEAVIEDYIGISIIDFLDNMATVSVAVSVGLKIKVNCYDPDSWVRDLDGDIHYRHKIEGVADRSEKIEAEFRIKFEQDNMVNFDIIETTVNDNNPLSFYLNEDVY